MDVILRAAAQVLAGQPYERASTNLIARVAGISVGSLYQYFRDKDAIFAALLERHVERIVSIVGARLLALTPVDLERSVRVTIEALFAAYAETPALHLAMYMQAARPGRLQRIVLESYDKAIALMVAYLRAHEPALVVADLERAAYLLAHAVDGALIATVFHRPAYLVDKRFIAETAELVTRYLTARRRRGSRPRGRPGPP